MEPTDVTNEILRAIQTDMRGVRDDLGGVRDDLRELGARVERVERRQVDAEIRLSTEIVSVVGVMQEVRDLLRDNLEKKT
jgi:hypothetical protein